MTEERLFSVRGIIKTASDGESGTTTVSTFCPAHSQEEAEKKMGEKLRGRIEQLGFKVEKISLAAEQVEIPGYEIILKLKK
jgi:hypothetical protein